VRKRLVLLLFGDGRFLRVLPVFAAVSALFGAWQSEVDGSAGSAAGESETLIISRWILLALGCLAVMAGVLWLIDRGLHRRSNRLYPQPSVPAEAASDEDDSAADDKPAAAVSDEVRLVVVEPLSVFYGQEGSLEQLKSVVRECDASVRDDTIENGYAALLSGAMDTAGFWELCGLAKQAPLLDPTMAARRELADGVEEFLAEMQRRRIPVAAVAVDVEAWSELARNADGLRTIWPWVLSSTEQTTDLAELLQALADQSSTALTHCLYLDTNERRLNTATRQGMKTVAFAGRCGTSADRSVENLEDLFPGSAQI